MSLHLGGALLQLMVFCLCLFSVDLDVGQLGLDMVCEVVVWLGLGQAGSAEKQGDQGQPGDECGICVFFIVLLSKNRSRRRNLHLFP